MLTWLDRVDLVQLLQKFDFNFEVLGTNIRSNIIRNESSVDHLCPTRADNILLLSARLPPPAVFFFGFPLQKVFFVYPIG